MPAISSSTSRSNPRGRHEPQRSPSDHGRGRAQRHRRLCRRDGERADEVGLQHDDLRGARLLLRPDRHPGAHDLAEPRRPADLPRRSRRCGRRRYRALRSRWLQARRRRGDEPGRSLRPASQQRGGLFAVLPWRRARRLCRQPRALGRYRRHAPGLRLERHDRHLRRRPADALAQDLRSGRTQRDAVADHPRQRALSGCEPRRPARADRVLPARRAALCRTDRALWPRHGRGLHRQSLGPGGTRGAPGRGIDPRWPLRGRKLPRQ